MANGIQGPKTNTMDVAIDLPSCVKITNKNEEIEFNNFIANIINASRAAWEKEKRTVEEPNVSIPVTRPEGVPDDEKLIVALGALDDIASWSEFDEPCSAERAQAALTEIRGGDGKPWEKEKMK